MIIRKTLCQIDPNEVSTWSNKLFLTIDIDWAHDDVIANTIDLLDSANVYATWFVTHDTPLIERLRENPKYELGIHPNFNWLLSGDYRNGSSPLEIIERLLKIVPEARCVRSHSMTQSTGLLQAFASAGLTHDVNHFIPASAGVELKPWALWNGMVRVPYCWEDDIFCIYRQQGVAEPDVTETANRIGLRIFDFHPIHVFLNTESINRYEHTRCLHQQPDQLVKHRYAGYGAYSQFLKLLDIMTVQESSRDHLEPSG